MKTQTILLCAALATVIFGLFACAPQSTAASQQPEREENYNLREVVFNGRRYLLQRQEIGYMRGHEWRVVAGPFL